MSKKPAGDSRFARNYNELADALGVSRKTVYQVRLDHGDAPKPCADGRHDVAAWRKHFLDKNIKGASEESDDGAPLTVTGWRAREIALKCAKLEMLNAQTAGKLIEAAAVEAGTSAMVSGFRQALNNLVQRLASKILGIKDFAEAEEIVQEEVNVVLRTLQRCDFIQAAAVIAPTAKHERKRKASPKKKERAKGTNDN